MAEKRSRTFAEALTRFSVLRLWRVPSADRLRRPDSGAYGDPPMLCTDSSPFGSATEPARPYQGSAHQLDTRLESIDFPDLISYPVPDMALPSIERVAIDVLWRNMADESLALREVEESDITVFFDYESDPEAVRMAAFTSENPSDRDAFLAHWERILASPTVITRCVVRGDKVLGSVLSYEESGIPEVTYWIGRQYWGQGVATEALTLFLQSVDRRRPMRARAAKDNLASIRVLEKCGFEVTEETLGFANARGTEIAELEFERSRD